MSNSSEGQEISAQALVRRRRSGVEPSAERRQCGQIKRVAAQHAQLARQGIAGKLQRVPFGVANGRARSPHLQLEHGPDDGRQQQAQWPPDKRKPQDVLQHCTILLMAGSQPHNTTTLTEVDLLEFLKASRLKL